MTSSSQLKCLQALTSDVPLLQREDLIPQLLLTYLLSARKAVRNMDERLAWAWSSAKQTFQLPMTPRAAILLGWCLFYFVGQEQKSTGGPRGFAMINTDQMC